MSLQSISPISSVSIPILLDWWQQRKRVASARINFKGKLHKRDETYLQAYYRLMEVYSVVKSGGVKAQTEAVYAFAERESSLLHQRLTAIELNQQMSEAEKQHDKAKIQQELDELRSANDWRLKALTSIDPDEEAIVTQHLPAIEKTLLQAKCA